jgi:hypothetical protein
LVEQSGRSTPFDALRRIFFDKLENATSRMDPKGTMTRHEYDVQNWLMAMENYRLGSLPTAGANVRTEYRCAARGG